MELMRLYEIADKNNISVYHFPLSPIKSMSVPGSIGIDADLLKTTRDEKAVLAHELGHCLHNAFYTGASDLQHRKMCEDKANRWEVETLLPFDELSETILSGCTSKSEIADFFDVPTSVVELACIVYENKLVELSGCLRLRWEQHNEFN